MRLSMARSYGTFAAGVERQVRPFAHMLVLGMLLMVMAGLERPDSGEVVVNGTPFNALDEDALARFRGRQVGIVFQSFHQIPTMTALENVAVPLELAGNPDAAARAAQELTSVGLGDRLHH